MRKYRAMVGIVILMAGIFSCAVSGEGAMAQKIEVRSPAFDDGDKIPRDFTCDGKNISPPVAWSGVPADAKSLAIIADDPDAPAGDWVHWLVYDLSPSLTQLPEGIPEGGRLSVGGSQGRTDFGTVGYGGPCPPKGTHRYFFKIYALDGMLHLKPGATKKELLAAMQGHVLAEGQLLGTYKRS